MEWVAISYRGSSRPRDRTRVSCITGRFFTIWATWEAIGGYKGGKKCETFILKQFQTCQAYSFSFSFLYPKQISVLYYSWTWTYMLFINIWDSDYSCIQRGKLLKDPSSTRISDHSCLIYTRLDVSLPSIRIFFNPLRTVYSNPQRISLSRGLCLQWGHSLCLRVECPW